MELLGAWTSHFQELAKSQVHVHEGLRELQQQLAILASESHNKDELFLLHTIHCRGSQRHLTEENEIWEGFWAQ